MPPDEPTRPRRRAGRVVDDAGRRRHGLSAAEVAERVAGEQPTTFPNERPDPSATSSGRTCSRASTRSLPCSRNRARHRLGDRRAVRPADHRQQRRRDHPGGPRQAHARRAGHRQPGQADGPAGRPATALPPDEVVLDDVIELGPGDQVVVDGEVVEAEGLEVDESLLTGEADPVDKQIGSDVLSGSFVASGAGAYRATKVGATPTPPSWPKRRAGSRWFGRSCARESTRSSSSSPT